MKKVLIDGDIILDAMTDKHPFSKNSAEILNLCELRVIHGYTTPVILSNLYYVLKRLGTSHKQILKNFTNLIRNILFDIATIDKTTILKALNSEFADFEDALQNFSAENHAEINIIITRNTKDYKKSTLSVMTPKEFISSME